MPVLNYLHRLNGFNRNAKLFLVSSALNGLGLSLFILLYNLYIISLGFRQDMIGLLTAIASLVGVAAALPMGWVVNRLGYRNSLTLGLAGSAVSVAVPLVWATAEAFIACELIWGVAFTLFLIVGSPFMAENSTEDERPYLFSLQFVISTLTTFVGCLFGGELPRLIGRWFSIGAETPVAYQGALWIGTALLLLSALPIMLLPRREAAHARTVRPRLRVRNPGSVARIILPGIVGAVGGGMFVPFVNVLWKVSHGLNDATIGQIMAFSALGMAVVGMATPPLARRWGVVRLMTVTQVLAVLGLIGFGFSPMFVIALSGYLIRDILMNVGRPLTGQFQMERSAEDERAAVSTLYTMAVSLAWGVASWVSGIWQAEGAFLPMYIGSAVFYLLSAGMMAKFFWREQRAQVDPESKVVHEGGLPLGSPAD